MGGDRAYRHEKLQWKKGWDVNPPTWGGETVRESEKEATRSLLQKTGEKKINASNK